MGEQVTITLTNASKTSIGIRRIIATGDFVETDDCVSVAPISPAGTCTINVAFTPTALGSRKNSMSITNSFNVVPLGVSLSGTGSGGDTTPPVTTATLSPGPNANGWNNSNVTVTLSSADSEPDGTGVRQVAYSASGAQIITSTVVNGASASFNISTEGITTIAFFGTDNAGNIEIARTLTIKLDKTQPTIAPVRTPGSNANGWNNTPVNVSFQCADALSGLAAGSPPAPSVLSSQGVGQTVNWTCTDIAGNSASASVQVINIDLTPPILTAALNPPPNANGWNNRNVTASFSAVDALSGVGTVSAPRDRDKRRRWASGHRQRRGPSGQPDHGEHHREPRQNAA